MTDASRPFHFALAVRRLTSSNQFAMKFSCVTSSLAPACEMTVLPSGATQAPVR